MTKVYVALNMIIFIAKKISHICLCHFIISYQVVLYVIIKRIQQKLVFTHIEGFGVNCKFKIENIENCLLDSRNYDIWSVDWEEHEDRFDSNINTFLLEQFYNEHKDFISEIVFKTRAYNSGYYQTLLETFVDKGLSSKEMHLLIFGTYTENDELGLRPLSKLSSDIIEQVGMESL